MERQKKCKGQMAIMSQSVGFPDYDQEHTYNRYVYYPIFTNGKENFKESEDGNIFQSVLEVKEYMERNRRTHLCFSEIVGVVGLTLERCLEYVFSNTSIQITKYATKGSVTSKTNQTFKNSEKKGQSIGKQIFSKKTYTPKEDTIVIKMEGKSYLEALTKIKQDINPNDIGVEIRDIRKTKAGNFC